MDLRNLRLLLPLLIVSTLLLTGSTPAGAGIITSRLRQLTNGTDYSSEIGVIVTLADRIDPKTFPNPPARNRRDALVGALRARATLSQGRLRRFLLDMGGRDIHSLWTINAIACRVRPELLDQLAAQPGVEEVRPDDTLIIPPFAPRAAAPTEWHLSAIAAPTLWNLGLTGVGVVVASLDTGIDPNHADLSGKWRSGPGGWFDPYGQHATPYDKNGHGTAVMGVMVGGSAGGTAIGVAPEASWIAAKIFNDSGIATYSAIHRAFAWTLDPDGDGDTGDAPRIVNSSWGINLVNSCQTEFQPDIILLQEAGIAVVFSAGNNGPNLSTSTSPANCSASLAVGSTNPIGAVSSFSSRGPSPCAPARIFPSLVAPGEQIRSAGLTDGGSHPLTYVSMDGTSFAAPQVSGLLALLLDANGFPATPVAELEASLEKSADDLGTPGLDNNSGAGLVNGLAAYRRLEGLPHLAVYDPAPPEYDRLLAFGNLPTGGNLARTLILRNSGNGHLALGALNGAALGPAFTIAADTCGNTSLPSDQTCAVTVSFAPLAAASYSGTLTLPTNDADQNPLSISLTGSGLSNSTPPQALFAPGKTLDFGSVAPGAASRLALTISNGGEALLTLAAINPAVLPIPFAVALDECSGRSLAGQESCRLEFSFSPAALQKYQAALTIASNADKATLSLTGLGNHPPTSATPLAPDNGASGLDPGAVVLRWQPATDGDGDAVSERVSLSIATSPGVNLLGGRTDRHLPTSRLWPQGLLLLVGLLACTLAWQHRPNWASLSLLVAMALAGSACGGGGGGDTSPAAATTHGTQTATNLQAATTYNWTVLSTDSHGAVSESPTWQFTTR